MKDAVTPEWTLGSPVDITTFCLCIRAIPPRDPNDVKGNVKSFWQLFDKNNHAGDLGMLWTFATPASSRLAYGEMTSQSVSCLTLMPFMFKPASRQPWSPGDSKYGLMAPTQCRTFNNGLWLFTFSLSKRGGVCIVML